MNGPPAHRSSFIGHRSRLLVLRLSALGDVIHTIPAVVGLKEHYDITWVVEAPYRELVEIVAGVQTIPVRLKKEPMRAFRAIKEMRGFDVSIDFQGLIKSAMLPWAARVKERIGFDREAIREKPALWFTNHKVHVDTSKHVIDQNLELALNVGRASARLPGGEGRAEARPTWSAFPEPIEARGEIVLLPGAGKPNKIWPHFAGLAKELGPRALVVWGPGEQVLAQAIGARTAPPTNLRELAYLLQKAEVVIGGDTGPLHLAAALGTKVIGLYGPTDPRRNGPYGQLARVIDHFQSTKSMESISVEEVVKTLERVASE
ncbi:MAG TPA: glycosyltransferase family 9 protein [Thermoanaerobaculia bacterium]|nr:glycosyltransferase family 9 protein [Thermoanaerobaculia bacterium]